MSAESFHEEIEGVSDVESSLEMSGGVRFEDGFGDDGGIVKRIDASNADKIIGSSPEVISPEIFDAIKRGDITLEAYE